MGEKEDKEKAEKLAAAKKRVAQLQKKKKAAGSTGSASIAKDVPKGKGKGATKTADDESQAVADDAVEESKDAPAVEAEEDADPDEAAFNDVIKTAQKERDTVDAEQEGEEPSAISPATSPPPASSQTPSSPRGHPVRQASVSLQSKIRSASFRQGAAPTSPGATGDDEFPDIYRKQMARIDELEKENKRLAVEVQEAQARWKKNEEELEEVRERAADRQQNNEENEEVVRLRSEIETLRRGSRASISAKGKDDADTTAEIEELRKEVESKEGTIGDMQLEISRLRAQASVQREGMDSESEQVAALQDSLRRAEEANVKLSTELSDVKKALTRASEKAMLDGTERTSKDTKLRALEREVEELQTERETSEKKIDTLEKKIEALNKLHRESEQRNAPKLASADATLKELQKTKAKLESVEKETLRLREARKSRMSGDGAEEGLDELEDEDRQKLEKRIRDLEGENFDLRRGVWRDKRRELQPNLSLGQEGDVAGVPSNTDDFDEVDLNGSGAATRKNSTQPPSRHSGFTQVFNSGLAAFRTSTMSPDSQQAQRVQTRPRNDSLLEEFEEDGFDEGAFAAAQREEEMRKMVEHVREVKKGLKEWSGWRLDLVDLRRADGVGLGFGEVFEV